MKEVIQLWALIFAPRPPPLPGSLIHLQPQRSLWKIKKWWEKEQRKPSPAHWLTGCEAGGGRWVRCCEIGRGINFTPDLLFSVFTPLLCRISLIQLRTTVERPFPRRGCLHRYFHLASLWHRDDEAAGEKKTLELHKGRSVRQLLLLGRSVQILLALWDSFVHHILVTVVKNYSSWSNIEEKIGKYCGGLQVLKE